MQDATDIRELTLVELGEVQGGDILLVAGGPIVGILVQRAIDGFVKPHRACLILLFAVAADQFVAPGRSCR